MRPILLALALFATLLVPRSPARADESTEQAKEHFKKGQTHYALGEFSQAADEFKEAFRLREVPIILFNIAQAMRLSGRSKEAVFYYSQYLTRQPDAANRAEVESRITELRSRLKVEQPPASSADADKPAKAAGAPKNVASAPPPAVAKAESKRSRRSAPPAAVKAPPVAEASIKSTTVAGYLALGAGVLLEGGAFVFHSSASSAADELSKKYKDGTLTQSDAHLRSDINSTGRLATMSAVGGALLLASGAVLVFAF